MSSVFGWSYPPGCSGPPEYDESCAVCGAYDIDQCVCPECPDCGSCGDPSCYEKHGLVKSQKQVDMFNARMTAEADQAKAEEAFFAKHFEEEQEYLKALDDFRFRG